MYKSKRRKAARENYLVATRQRKNRTQSRPFFKAAATPKFFLKITENLRTLFANFRELVYSNLIFFGSEYEGLVRARFFSTM